VDRHFKQLKAVKMMGISLPKGTTQVLSTGDEAEKLKYSSHNTLQVSKTLTVTLEIKLTSI
jgi:hypothetical protein